jgi:hypothetical protein
MRAIILLMVVAFGTPSYGQDSAELGPNTDEHPFQCGAAFAMMAAVYQEAGDAKMSARYQNSTSWLHRRKVSIPREFSPEVPK